MKITCVIPAHLASTRFPEKILYVFNGASLLEHTWRAAMHVSLFDEVIIALDSSKTAQVVTQFGGKYIMTDPALPSGTHRMIAATQDKKSDIWVNWQADEPLVNQQMITDLLANARLTNKPHIWTLKTAITEPALIHDPHAVKVVTDTHNNALYFSRAPIPYCQKPSPDFTYYKHIGLYAYNTPALQQISHLTPCPLATAESLEQLQFLSNGIPITVNQTAHTAHGIDTINDLAYITQKE